MIGEIELYLRPFQHDSNICDVKVQDNIESSNFTVKSVVLLIDQNFTLRDSVKIRTSLLARKNQIKTFNDLLASYKLTLPRFIRRVT